MLCLGACNVLWFTNLLRYWICSEYWIQHCRGLCNCELVAMDEVFFWSHYNTIIVLLQLCNIMHSEEYNFTYLIHKHRLTLHEHNLFVRDKAVAYICVYIYIYGCTMHVFITLLNICLGFMSIMVQPCMTNWWKNHVFISWGSNDAGRELAKVSQAC